MNLYELVSDGVTPNSKRLVFENILYVTYIKEGLPDSYMLTQKSQFIRTKKSNEVQTQFNEQVSQMFMFEDRDFIEFEQNGYVINPLDYLVSGYWGFERVGDMMPIDYGFKPADNN